MQQSSLRRYPCFAVVILALFAGLLFLISAPLVRAQNPPPDLTQLSIENLMNMEVISASKKEESISRTAAAIYVITQEDIRRSGMNSLPELLRMVPGMDVARINGNEWAISARGFNARFANKLLVLIDGRSLYSPDFAGIFWQLQHLMLADIERIEVIRGPGATLWGANAVNGVINIITKKAKDTQGGLVNLGGGSQEFGETNARYGAYAGEKLAYRFFGNYFNNGEFRDSAGHGASDSSQGARLGVRGDWQPSPRDALIVESDVEKTITQENVSVASFGPPFEITPLGQTAYLGVDLFGKWTHTYSAASEMSLQAYYDGLKRDDILFDADIHVFGLEYQDRFAIGSRNDVLWGAGYRATWDSISTAPAVFFVPPSLRTNLESAFVQDEITLLPNKLYFTPGIKFEESPFTGFHVEPSGRLLWSFTAAQSVWASAALADRTPQRSEEGLRDLAGVFQGPSGTLIAGEVIGNPNAQDETVLDFEVGYRAQVTKTLSIDLATFYDHYKSLQTIEPGVPFFSDDPVPHWVFPQLYANEMHGHGYGGEVSLGWKPTSRWKLSAGYSFLRQILKPNLGSLDQTSELAAGDSPVNQFQLRSQWNLPYKSEFDASLYHVGKLLDQSIPSYTRVDVRLGWHPRSSVDIDLIGQNLLAPRHLEFINNSGIVPTYDPRKVFVRLTWRFSH